MRYLLLFIITYIVLFQSVFPLSASSENCLLDNTPAHIPISVKIDRFIDGVLPYLLMDPALQIDFRIRQAKKRIQIAESVALSNPPYAYQEALRSVHQTTLLEKPLRAIADREKIPITDIYNMLDILSSNIKKLEQMQDKPCMSKYAELSDFLSRNKKTIKKIYYESLLVPTKENYSEK